MSDLQNIYKYNEIKIIMDSDKKSYKDHSWGAFIYVTTLPIL